MKMEQGADTFSRRVSQGHNRPWSDDELAIIYEMAGKRCTKAMIERAVPGRSYAAVKLKLHAIRSADYDRGKRAPKGNGDHGSIGVNPLDPNDPGFDDGWFDRHRRDMRDANKTFLAALQKSFA